MYEIPRLFDEDLDVTIPAERLARSTDGDTAKEAAELASRRGPNQRVTVYRWFIANGGGTDYEASTSLGLLRSSVAKRRQELVELGLITDSGIRRPTDTGVNAAVWRLAYAEHSDLKQLPDKALATIFSEKLREISTAYDEDGDEIDQLRAENERLRAEIERLKNGF